MKQTYQKKSISLRFFCYLQEYFVQELRYIAHKKIEEQINLIKTIYRKVNMIELAVAKRIKQLCMERQISINDMANISGITSSTVYSMLNGKSKNLGIVTIKKICDGLDITIVDFFNSSLFLDLEQELY